MMLWSDLLARLPINRLDLDRECAEQSVLFEEAAEYATNKKAEFRKAKIMLERIKAEQELWVRRNPDEQNVKLSEATVAALVTVRPDVVKQQDIVLELERDAAGADYLLNAFDHRRSMLNDIVELIKIGYGATDAISLSSAERNATMEGIANARQKKG
jgi:hypothetical protein